MKIALIAPPFIAVPPKRYGGTELFLAELAMGLAEQGIDVTLYTNGESTIPIPVKFLYETEEWPVIGEAEANLKSLNHSAWAVKDVLGSFDLVHMNNAPGLTLTRFLDIPVVYTVHHAYEKALDEFYGMFPEVCYVTISEFQRTKLNNPLSRTIHHGIDLTKYRLQPKKQEYLSFLGRIAPVKGTHLAIEIAKKAGIPLKIAGEIQPIYNDYWKTQIRPHVDGRFIEYVGEIGLEGKNELLGNSMAMLFPIQWDEPFGLVMVESMACGTPVLAIPGGSVGEVVLEGVSGCVRQSVDELAECARNLKISPFDVRHHAEQNFCRDLMASKYVELYADMLGSNAAEQADQAVA